MLFTCFSMTVFVEEVYTDEGQYRYVDDIDEYLTQLNAGFIAPLNTNHSMGEIAETHTSVSPMSWPWTDCSNILEHDWTGWSAWVETRRIHNRHKGEGYCNGYINRSRSCKRTYCSASTPLHYSSSNRHSLSTPVPRCRRSTMPPHRLPPPPCPGVDIKH